MAGERQIARSDGGSCLPKLLSCILIVFVALLVSMSTVWYMYNMDGETGYMPYTAYACSSDLVIDDQIKMAQKGMAIDDTTFDCPGKILTQWPHTTGPVKALRLFRTTQPGWDETRISQFRISLAAHVRHTGAKVLVGTQITCSEPEDDADWAHTLDLLKTLNASHVLGLAVGNELDQLAYKGGTTKDCVTTMWSGYLLSKLHARMEDVRKIPGFEQLPVTSVFTAGVVWDTGAFPFKDTPDCRVNTFLTQVIQMEPNWVFTLNFYPYFDPTIGMDPDGTHCKAAMEKCKCFDKASCLNILSMQQSRKAMTRLTGDPNARFWVGEVGWSAPMASTLHTTVSRCTEFSGYKMFYDYYKNFLAWDLTIPKTYDESSSAFAPPEMAFYFSMRDSANFGAEEHFGLIDTCDSSSCKLNRERADVALSTGLQQPLSLAAVTS
eukprot:CAMPEP_0115466944 /NCGR_PEP_ID=MMETSP0271-20121206/50182_1 /TAXON_ID=71861 /ORGANISM="Scrippsiella trochoidea, Strain CCMP3099" /LENGTH=436 /DNA_ID=CAMNT_0002893941 /DNA_START=1 /DNA_END=1311 /DNA_ORIENTATION=-